MRTDRFSASREIGRRTLSVLGLLLALAAGSGTAAVADEAKPTTPVLEAVQLQWFAIGSQHGLAIGDGMMLTTKFDGAPSGFTLLPVFILSSLETQPQIAAAASITEVSLAPVSPNPNPGKASITFALPRASQVNLAIFDLQGRQLDVLANGVLEAGPHTIAWNGTRNQKGPTAGVYFVRLTTPERVINRRMVVSF